MNQNTVTVNFLAHNRNRTCSLAFAHLLNSLSEDVKQRISVNYLATDDPVKRLENVKGLSIKYFNFPQGNNYMRKVEAALANSGEICLKLDEDCLMSKEVFEFIIGQAVVIAEQRALLVSPLVTSGIPSVDLFIESFVKDEPVISELKRYFVEQRYPRDLWGVDYSSLNGNVRAMNGKWDPTTFYLGVAKIDSYYKGIHPIRLSLGAQILLLQYVESNLERFLSPRSLNLLEFSPLYFTNHVFLISKNSWKRLITLENDGFDEVPLNNMMKTSGMKSFLVDHGYCLHSLYNTVYDSAPSGLFGDRRGRPLEEIVWMRITRKYLALSAC